MSFGDEVSMVEDGSVEVCCCVEAGGRGGGNTLSLVDDRDGSFLAKGAGTGHVVVEETAGKTGPLTISVDFTPLKV